MVQPVPPSVPPTPSASPVLQEAAASASATLPGVSATALAPDGTPVPWSYLLDMDGVLVHEDHLVPGADEFLREITERGVNYVVVTNNPIFTRRDLRARLAGSGLDIPEDRIWTSALATAKFLDSQRPNGTAYVIGEVGLTTAMHEAGYILTDRNPDYVVLGETRTYSFEAITTAIRLIDRGSRFVATNPDPTGPSREGLLPAAGAIAALIEKATGKSPYFVGKPNPIMMRSALRAVGAHSSTTVMIGDRMDTDVIAGLEAGLRTILVLSGISTPQSVEAYPFRPSLVIGSVADLVGRTHDPFGLL